MGNEISTLGGAVATVGTAVAAGVTFGQVDALNKAVVECAEFTEDKASKTIVRHAGETVVSAVATGATAVAAGVTFGQVECLNEAVIATAKNTAEAGTMLAKESVTVVNDLADTTPVVGHVKGTIHYVCGDKEGGDQAMKSASRTTGVIGGGILGVAGGPVGMVAGGIAGGAAMDGITTGVESAIKHEYTPSGQIRAWTDVVNGAKNGNSQQVIGGVVGGLVTPVMDGFVGYQSGKFRQNYEAMLEKPEEVTYNGRAIPEEGWAEDGSELFRGDKKLLSEEFRNKVFEEGIDPKEWSTGTDAYDHTESNSARERFISTTKDQAIAEDFGWSNNRANNAVVKIVCKDGVDIVKTGELLGEDVIYPNQSEVAVYDKIQPECIKGVIVKEGEISTWYDNPNFDPPSFSKLSYVVVVLKDARILLLMVASEFQLVWHKKD